MQLFSIPQNSKRIWNTVRHKNHARRGFERILLWCFLYSYSHIPRAVTSCMLLCAFISIFVNFIIPEHVYIPSSPSSTVSIQADLSRELRGTRDRWCKDEGRGREEFLVVELLFQIPECWTRPSVKTQGKETDDPTAAYTIEESAGGVETPGDETRISRSWSKCQTMLCKQCLKMNPHLWLVRMQLPLQQHCCMKHGRSSFLSHFEKHYITQLCLWLCHLASIEVF